MQIGHERLITAPALTSAEALDRAATDFDAAIAAGDPRAALAAFRRGCAVMDDAIDQVLAAAADLREARS